MKQDVRQVLSQQVERILPPVPWLHKAAVWAAFAVLGWVLLAIFFGGLCWWAETLAGIR